MKILVISYSYPFKGKEYYGVFVRKLALYLKKYGHDITVISPKRLFLDKDAPKFEEDFGISVFRPRFLSLSGRKIFGFNMAKITQFLFNRSVLKTIRRKKIDVDCFYSHFLSPSGYCASFLAKKTGKKAYCAMGESSFEHIFCNNDEEVSNQLKRFSGIIIPTVKNEKLLKDRYLLNNTFHIRNGADIDNYVKMSKIEAREKLKLSQSDKIVVFLGSFIHRKGPLRVYEACKKLSLDINFLFLGSGSLGIDDDAILFEGQVESHRVSTYLCAADVFVLPTISEGMSNAVLEAMVCEIPIVTSPIDSNLELLGEGYSYFCDPLDIKDISLKVEKALSLDRIVYNSIPTLDKRAIEIDQILRHS